MFRPRVIPVLLLDGLGLVKTTKFNKKKYIGDPINAVKIFNELHADELFFVDISATKNNRSIPLSFIKEVGAEAFMPFSVGGGISNVDEARNCIQNGAEKIILNSHALVRPDLIKECADAIGSQGVVVSIDTKKLFFSKYGVYGNNGINKSRYNPIDWAKYVVDLGAGEIIINDIDNDGMMEGYNLNLIKIISESVNIPIVICGGAGKLSDFKLAINAGAHAVAAGSMFVYHGPRKAVLVNYPKKNILNKLFVDNE